MGLCDGWLVVDLVGELYGFKMAGLSEVRVCGFEATILFGWALRA